MKVYFAADHAGFELKQQLVPYVRSLGHEVEDCGALVMSETDDYPEFMVLAARKLAADVQSGVESRAILIGGSGEGEAMVANRFKGVRATVYYGPPRQTHTSDSERALDIVSLSREHNDANALALGARFLSLGDAKEAVRIWLERPFGGAQRHARRIKMIDDITGYSVYE